MINFLMQGRQIFGGRHNDSVHGRGALPYMGHSRYVPWDRVCVNAQLNEKEIVSET